MMVKKFYFVEKIFVASNEHAAEIIGIGGYKVKRIAKDTHTFINCPSPLQPPIFEIYGNLQSNILHAKKLIQSYANHFDEIRKKKRRIFLDSADDEIGTIVFQNSDIPFIIGKEGRQIKKIMQISQVKIISPDKNKTQKIFILIGPPKNIKMCKFFMKLTVFVAIGIELQQFSINEIYLLENYKRGIIDESLLNIDKIVNINLFEDKLKYLNFVTYVKLESDFECYKKNWNCWRCRKNCARVAFGLCGHTICCSKCIQFLYSDIYLRCFHNDCNKRIESFIIHDI